jgi:uncharacterized protein YdaU (DUF1376 family)
MPAILPDMYCARCHADAQQSMEDIDVDDDLDALFGDLQDDVVAAFCDQEAQLCTKHKCQARRKRKAGKNKVQVAADDKSQARRKKKASASSCPAITLPPLLPSRRRKAQCLAK